MTLSSHKNSISVFFPVFNDHGTIAGLVKDALSVLPSFTDDYEVILINDGSTDQSGALADELARTSARVKVVHHENNQGYGGALRTGFQHATGDLIFYTDGDGQYDVLELALLIPLMTDGVDVVNGYKIKREDNYYRRASGAIYNSLARYLFRLPIRDVDCDFRLIRRTAMHGILLSKSSGAICVELVRKLNIAGCAFREVPVHHYSRPHGKSQFFTPRRVARTIFDFCGIWIASLLQDAGAFQ
jgi:glycosyltransferase involved in cell wall biosynthesis